LSLRRALNFLRHSTVSCLCIIDATRSRCYKHQQPPYLQTIIGVIYGGTRGTGTPRFRLRGTVPPIFKTKDEEFAVNRSDLLRLNYNKTIFGWGSTPDPAGRAHDALTPGLDEKGILPPHYPPLSPRDPMAPRSPSELVPPTF